MGLELEKLGLKKALKKPSKPRRQYRISEKVQGDSQRSNERNMTFWYFQIFSKWIRNTTQESSKSLCPLRQECIILRRSTLFSALAKLVGKPSAVIASVEESTVMLRKLNS
jgi:hypothetical protein